MSETVVKDPVAYEDHPVGRPEEAVDVMFGSSIETITFQVGQSVSPEAGEAVRVESDALRARLAEEVGRIDAESAEDQDRDMHRVESRAKGFSRLALALSKGLRGDTHGFPRNGEGGNKVVLGLAETTEELQKREKSRREGFGVEHFYQVGTQKDASLAIDDIYTMLGARRPVIGTHAPVVGNNIKGEEVGPVSYTGQVDGNVAAQPPEGVKIERSENGAITRIETTTPAGVKIVESWTVASVPDGSFYGGVHDNVLYEEGANHRKQAFDTTRHTVEFERV